MLNHVTRENKCHGYNQTKGKYYLFLIVGDFAPILLIKFMRGYSIISNGSINLFITFSLFHRYEAKRRGQKKERKKRSVVE